MILNDPKSFMDDFLKNGTKLADNRANQVTSDLARRGDNIFSGAVSGIADSANKSSISQLLDQARTGMLQVQQQNANLNLNMRGQNMQNDQFNKRLDFDKERFEESKKFNWSNALGGLATGAIGSLVNPTFAMAGDRLSGMAEKSIFGETSVQKMINDPEFFKQLFGYNGAQQSPRYKELKANGLSEEAIKRIMEEEGSN